MKKIKKGKLNETHEFGNVDEHFVKISEEEREILADPMDYINRYSQQVTALNNMIDKDQEV